MRAARLVMTGLVIVGAAILACGQGNAAADPTIQLDFSNPQISPAQWTLTLRPDGGGHFRSVAGKTLGNEAPGIRTPALDRDIRVSATYAGHVFDIAHQQHGFDGPCESHMKVAFQGWKTLTYTGPEGHGSCTFNFSKDKEIQELSDSLQAVAETVLEGARLELLLEHDRLGLDAETEFLVEAAGDGRVQQICAIHDILERLAQDDQVLERVRKRARMLLAQSSS